MPSDRKFDLWFKRHPTISSLLRMADSNETDESFHERKREHNELKAINRRLNNLNTEVRELIDTRLWATMYLNYFITRIHTTTTADIEFNDLPKLGKLSVKDEPLPTPPSLKEKYEPPFHEESLELQVQILKQRLKDAHIGVDAIWATLEDLINTLTSEIDETPPDTCIGFRVFDDQSQARLFPTGDIRCGNWQEFDVKQELIRKRAEDHITQAWGPTDYISISTSPRRLWNLVHKRRPKEKKLAVIDLRVLQRLGIAYGSTTDDLGFRNTGMNRTEYATKHHVLVLGWIPRRSMLGFISSETFAGLLEEAHIDTSTDRRDIPAAEYDKTIPFNQISRRFNTTTRSISKGAK
ncbi:hypothetical protein CC79DRAFT_1334029 [Sarocladium strictum]